MRNPRREAGLALILMILLAVSTQAPGAAAHTSDVNLAKNLVAAASH